MPPGAAAFETIGLAKLAKSAVEAKELGFLRGTDQVTFNRERLLADAKKKALSLVEGYQPPAPLELFLPGPSGKASLAYALRDRSEEHTSELQSLMRTSYAVFCLKNKTHIKNTMKTIYVSIEQHKNI